MTADQQTAAMRAILAQHATEHGRPYQTHTWGGQELNQGIRGIERRAMIRTEDVLDRRVLDLGCATGAETIWAYGEGANHALGLEQRPENVLTALRLAHVVDPDGMALDFRCADLSRGLPQDVAMQSYPGWHTCFCFSLVHHLGYWRIWDGVPGLQVVYVEGGSDSPLTTDWLEQDGRWRAELMGWSPDSRANPALSRPLWRLARRTT